MKRGRRGGAALVALFCAGAAAQEPADQTGASVPAGPVIVVSGSLETYRRASQSLIRELERRGVRAELVELPGGPDDSALEATVRRIQRAAPSVLATAGQAVTQWALRHLPGTPVVFFMTPNILDEPYIAGGAAGTGVCGVTSDLAPEQILAGLAQWMPGAKTIGILHSSATQRTVDALVSAAARGGRSVAAIPADRERFPDALRALDEQRCDAALMILDPQVYTAPNIKMLLLWGVRQRRPVWGFSENIVKAGALGGQFFDEERLGAQTAELVVKVQRGQAAGDARFEYAGRARRAVNLHTARMIGLTITPDQLGEDVTRFGEEP